jgi:hypothetical protein
MMVKTGLVGLVLISIKMSLWGGYDDTERRGYTKIQDRWARETVREEQKVGKPQSGNATGRDGQPVSYGSLDL